MALARLSTVRRLALAATLLASFACGKDDPVAPKVLTTITVTATPTSLEMGQTANATADGADQDGATFNKFMFFIKS